MTGTFRLTTDELPWVVQATGGGCGAQPLWPQTTLQNMTAPRAARDGTDGLVVESGFHGR